MLNRFLFSEWGHRSRLIMLGFGAASNGAEWIWLSPRLWWNGPVAIVAGVGFLIEMALPKDFRTVV